MPDRVLRLPFQDLTEGWLPSSAAAVGRLGGSLPGPSPLRQTPTIGLRSLASAECQKAASHSQCLLPASRQPCLSPDREPPTCGSPAFLASRPRWSCTPPWGRTGHSTLTQLPESSGSGGEHVTWIWPRRCTGKSARRVPGKASAHRERALEGRKTNFAHPLPFLLGLLSCDERSGALAARLQS